MYRRALLLLALIALAGACASPPQPLALVASSPGSLETGAQRVLLALIDTDTQAFVADPDLPATADFTGPNGEEVPGVPLEFLWGVEDVRGLYRARVEFPVPGNWTVTISPEGMATTEPAPIIVSEDTEMPQIGDQGPPVATLTASDADLSEISTDPEPDPDFYRLSLDDAMSDDRPTVVVFATPAFCTSETCGPTLDHVKEVAAAHPEVDFVHIEIYENLDADSPEDLIPAPAVEAWGLPSEPWVFVTDTSGLVTARFEGAIDPEELDGAVAALGA